MHQIRSARGVSPQPNLACDLALGAWLHPWHMAPGLETPYISCLSILQAKIYFSFLRPSKNRMCVTFRGVSYARKYGRQVSPKVCSLVNSPYNIIPQISHTSLGGWNTTAHSTPTIPLPKLLFDTSVLELYFLKCLLQVFERTLSNFSFQPALIFLWHNSCSIISDGSTNLQKTKIELHVQ